MNKKPVYSSSLFRSISDNSSDMLWAKDLAGRYVFVNTAACDTLLLAQNSEEPLGNTIDYFSSRQQVICPDEPQWYTFGHVCKVSDEAVLDSGKAMSFQDAVYVRGERIYLDIHKAPFYGSDGKLAGTVASARNVTENIELKELLVHQSEDFEYQSHHDELTCLPNRLYFRERLDQAISHAQSNGGMVALLFIDLDHFKHINDSYGHDTGDLIIEEVAKRIQSKISVQHTLSRLGGDEFALIVEEVKGISYLSLLTQELIEVIKPPISINSQQLYVTASIGISLYPNDASNSHDLLKYADTAMYLAKGDGRDTFQFYTRELTEQAFERIAMETGLRRAIEKQQFVVYYQPKVNARNGEITGMEALVRWDHPVLGIVRPSEFMSLAEENGMVIEIDRWVMNTAMQQFKRWMSNSLRLGILSLNLSVKQIETSDFVDYVASMLQKHDFDPSLLELEVTETQIMKNPQHSIDVLSQLNELGIRIAIDDFGTGYSSLAYLKRLHVNTVKIDRSFIMDLPHNEHDSAITKAIIVLAKSLHLDVIAEGVETDEQQHFLLENDCDNIQGFLHAKPMDKDNMTKYLESGI